MILQQICIDLIRSIGAFILGKFYIRSDIRLGI